MLASIIRHSREFANIVDLEGHMVYLNEAGMRMLGIPAEEASGTHIMQAFPEQLKEKVLQEVVPAMQAGGWEGELEFKHFRTGALIPVRSDIFPILDSRTGAPLFYANLSMDITEDKRRESEREDLIAKLKQALKEVKTLSGLLPICAGCKKIRDDQGYWNQIEVYLRDRTDAQFSHGLCPDCSHRLYPDFFNKKG